MVNNLEITQADLSPAEEIDWDEEDVTVERRKTKRWDRERIKKREQALCPEEKEYNK